MIHSPEFLLSVAKLFDGTEVLAGPQGASVPTIAHARRLLSRVFVRAFAVTLNLARSLGNPKLQSE
jgi:hypothetical protein